MTSFSFRQRVGDYGSSVPSSKWIGSVSFFTFNPELKFSQVHDISPQKPACCVPVCVFSLRWIWL